MAARLGICREHGRYGHDEHGDRNVAWADQGKGYHDDQFDVAYLACLAGLGIHPSADDASAPLRR